MGSLSPTFSSAIQFLRTYNNLIVPTSSDINDKILEIDNSTRNSTMNFPLIDTTNCIDQNNRQSENNNYSNYIIPSAHFTQNLIGYHPSISKLYQTERKTGPFLPRSLTLNNYLNFANTSKRQRGEKKPIPDEQKDEKYFERRKRNNQAAKKSRDARKIREDQIALRATMLEHENALLRAQILTLREETESLRQLLFLKKSTPSELQICHPA